MTKPEPFANREEFLAAIEQVRAEKAAEEQDPVYDEIDRRLGEFFTYGMEPDFDALSAYVKDVYIEGYEQGYEEGCND